MNNTQMPTASGELQSPLQGLASYLRCEASGLINGSEAHKTITQWAAEVDRLLAAQQEDAVDKGPWTCDTSNGKVYLQSDDFRHDARLYVDGDFAVAGDKLKYAQSIADRLNTTPPAPASEPEGERAGYLFLPCPICGGTEGCDDAVPERRRAHIEQEIAARYHIESSTGGFWRCCVKAGNGEREIYAGTRKNCELIRAALQEACLDGAFIASKATQPPAPAAVQPSEARRVWVNFYAGDRHTASNDKQAAIERGNATPGAKEVAVEFVEAHQQPTRPVNQQPRLKVVLTAFPESNGKRNWTALLVREEPWDGLIGNCGGVSLDRGEYWNRVAYEAERARFLIGERDTEPFILDYGDDIKTPEEWKGEVEGGRKPRNKSAQAATD